MVTGVATLAVVVAMATGVLGFGAVTMMLRPDAGMMLGFVLMGATGAAAAAAATVVATILGTGK